MTADRLRIGVLASIAHRTPPRAYGPWEQVASTLAEGLVARGHEVTLFATADSCTAGRLHAVAPHGYEEPGVPYDVKALECLHVAGAFERAGELDVLSNQFDFLPLSYSRLVDIPVVTTVHGFSSTAVLPVYRAYDRHVAYVSISDADRSPDLTYEATVHHGLDLRRFTFRPDGGEHLLTLGRIHPHKGTHTAIEIARRCGRPLVIAGVVHDRAYFRELVEPHLGRDGITWVGDVGPQQRDELLGSALALLHLIAFAEPFGLAVVEALATGTPVIAYGLGALPEIVQPGVTGFLVDDVVGAVSAVGQVERLDRSTCRTDVEVRFSAARMVDDYEAVFARVVSRSRSAGRSARAKRTEESLQP